MSVLFTSAFRFRLFRFFESSWCFENICCTRGEFTFPFIQPGEVLERIRWLLR